MKLLQQLNPCPLVNEYTIAPRTNLSQFVDQYVLSTSLGRNITILGSWAASPETSLVFYLADQPQQVALNADSQLYHKANCLIGLQTRCNGRVHFEGVYHTFIVQFKANGFRDLFGIPASEVTNRVIVGEDILGPPINDLQDQLQAAGDIRQMAALADSFLLALADRQTRKADCYPAITAVSHQVGSSKRWLTVEQYAYQCNMSVRNFERRFTQQTGIPPKSYIRLVRFNEVVKAKLQEPFRSLTGLAYEFGYYDQMHMIKEFRQFAQLSPSEFFIQSALTGQPVERQSYS